MCVAHMWNVLVRHMAWIKPILSWLLLWCGLSETHPCRTNSVVFTGQACPWGLLRHSGSKLEEEHPPLSTNSSPLVFFLILLWELRKEDRDQAEEAWRSLPYLLSSTCPHPWPCLLFQSREQQEQRLVNHKVRSCSISHATLGARRS